MTLGLGAAIVSGSAILVAAPASADESTSAESSTADTAPSDSTSADESSTNDAAAESTAGPPSSTVSASTVEITKDLDAKEDSTGLQAKPDGEEPALEEESGGDETGPSESPVPESGEGSDSPIDEEVNDAGSDDSASTPVRAARSTATSETVETTSVTTPTTAPAPKSVSSAPLPAVDVSMAATTSTSETVLATTAVEPVHQPSFLQGPITLHNIITDVLTWIGLGPLAVNLPIGPETLPPPVESLWLVVRRIGYTFLNQLPTANVTITTQNIYTGVTAGQLNATDYDDNQLTYSVINAPAHGTVVVNPDGTFTYKPAADFADAGGTDSFTVRIDDTVGGPWRVHGLSGLLGFNSTVETVTVRVAPVDQTPKTLVRQAHENFTQAQAKTDEANGLGALAEAGRVSARQKRDAAAAILANNPDPQMKADAAELIRQAEVDEATAAAYETQETAARHAAQDLRALGFARIDEARSLNPDVEIGDVRVGS